MKHRLGLRAEERRAGTDRRRSSKKGEITPRYCERQDVFISIKWLFKILLNKAGLELARLGKLLVTISSEVLGG